MINDLDFRTGFFRIWLVAAVIWIGCALWIWNQDVEYAFRYCFQHEQLVEDVRKFDHTIDDYYRHRREVLLKRQVEAIGRFRADQLSEGNQALKRAGVNLPEPKPEPELAEVNSYLEKHTADQVSPSPPSWLWVAGVLVPPIVLYAISIAVFALVRWIWQGFASRRS
jgi:hypothetical protein